MKLTFIGADREVTGSLHLLEACGIKVAIDMGMEQGQNPFENAPMPIKYIDLDYIILTHAHIDHAGMIPLAFKNGFTGTVLCTEATEALANIMLRDSAYIQESEAEYKSKKALRAGKKPVEPVYDVNDALVALENFRSVPYGQTVELADGFTVKFTDAGHLLGSASAEIRLEENGVKKTIVFSGDIGNYDKPLIRNPQYIKNADFVVMESTYGDRNHERVTDHIEELTRIIQSPRQRRKRASSCICRWKNAGASVFHSQNQS